MTNCQVLETARDSRTERRQPARRDALALAVIAGAATVLLTRAYLTRRAELAACEFFREPCTNGGALHLTIAELRLWHGWIPQYGALVAASVLCARGLWPKLLAVPALAFAFWPVFVSGEPNALVSPWAYAFPGSFFALVVAALLVVATAAAPAVLVRRQPDLPIRPSLVLATAVGMLAILVATRAAMTGVPITHPATAVVVASFALGFLGARSLPLLPVMLLIPVALSWNDGSWHPSDWTSILVLAWPTAALALGRFAAEIELWARRCDLSTTALVVLVNGLNVADALATQLAVLGGGAAEANPVVRAVGLPVKVFGVALASVVIARWKPRALVLPAVALSLVAAWHVSGLLTNR